MKTIQEVLHYENILRVVEEVKDLSQTPVPDRMFTPTDTVMGNTGSYVKVTSSRQIAQAVMYGAPSKNVKLQGVSKVPVTCIHSFEHIQHTPNTVMQLKSEDGGIQRMGIQTVGRQARDFALRFIRLRRAAWYQALTTGLIYLDSEGDLLPSAAGAAITINFGIPAGNKNQLNALGKGNIIAASWATAGTNIPNHIAGIQMAAAQLTGYRITTAYYGKNIPGYVASNTAMKEFLKMNPPSNAAVLSGAIPDGFINLKWREAYSGLWVDGKGVSQVPWGDDMVVFTPDEADLGWWGFLEGTYPIPTDIGEMSSDVIAALNSVQTVAGQFGYAQVTHDPVGIKQFGGDTFLPVINVPKAVFVADVTP